MASGASVISTGTNNITVAGLFKIFGGASPLGTHISGNIISQGELLFLNDSSGSGVTITGGIVSNELILGNGVDVTVRDDAVTADKYFEAGSGSSLTAGNINLTNNGIIYGDELSALTTITGDISVGNELQFRVGTSPEEEYVLIDGNIVDANSDGNVADIILKEGVQVGIFGNIGDVTISGLPNSPKNLVLQDNALIDAQNIFTNRLVLSENARLYGAQLVVGDSYEDEDSSTVWLAGRAAFANDTLIKSQNFTSNWLYAGGNLEIAPGARVSAGTGGIRVVDDDNQTHDISLGHGAVLHGGYLFARTYSDTATSTVELTEDAEFTGDSTINSTNFRSGRLLAHTNLTLSEGAQVTSTNATGVMGLFVAHNGSSLTSNYINFFDESRFYGTTNLNGNVLANGNVTIGNPENHQIGKLNVTGDWDIHDKTVTFVVDGEGKVGDLTITGVASATGKAPNTGNVLLTGSTAAKSLLAAQVSVASENSVWGSNVKDLIKADQSSDNNVFTHENTINSYKFVLKPVTEGNQKIWKLGAVNEAVTPEISSLFTINIVGFDLPRAQNVSGPWARMKGGSASDDKSQFDENSFQMLQIGWDKSFNSAIGNGSWYAGVLLEGDWMYGNGVYYRDRDTNNPVNSGHLKSEQRGIGAGLYVSRNFENGWYFDVLGRISLFDSQVNMTSNNLKTTASYNGNWTDQIFAMGLEVGKTFNSKNKRWTFSPYNRLLYNSTPNKQFTLNFEGDRENNLVLYVHNQSVDAWTNQLGARLFWNSQNKDRTSFGSIFVGGEYFQGLSGRFGTLTRGSTSTRWQASTLGRSKNDLGYGLATAGITLRPREDIMLHSQADVLFGDVSGWALTLGGRYSY